jgi:hypothetical protein
MSSSDTKDSRVSDLDFLSSRFDAAGLVCCDDHQRRLAMLTVCHAMCDATIAEIRDVLGALGLLPVATKPLRGFVRARSRGR